jgi:hypothetical protein
MGKKSSSHPVSTAAVIGLAALVAPSAALAQQQSEGEPGASTPREVSTPAPAPSANEPAPGSTAATEDAPAATAGQPVERESLAHDEQGRVNIEKSFDWNVQERLKADHDPLKATKFELKFRSMYFDQDRFDSSTRETWAIGGSFGAKTGYFWNHLAAGATFFTSQPLYGPNDKDGGMLLQPGQDGYNVLGELYGDIRITDGLNAYLGRKGYDTPFINRHDVRMTPNTFEAYTLKGTVGEKKYGQLDFGGGYFDKIKPMNENQFFSMAEQAGASVDRGVFVVGARYTLDKLTIGAIEYFCEDVINIIYSEAKLEFAVGELRPHVAVQFIDQRNVGDNALTNESFSAQQAGFKMELPLGPATLAAGYTQVFGNADMRSPWGGYPGWTSVQVQDFDREGEGAFFARANYDFKALLDGLSCYALAVFGTDPDPGNEYRQNEYNFNVQWAPTDGLLKNLSLRVRYAIVEQFGGDTENVSDFRVIADYNIPF